MAPASTTALLERAAAGDQDAWELIVDRYSRLVWSVVRSFQLDEAAAADTCQTVWLRLVEHCGSLREPERLPAWLATTARREALRTLRSRRREVPEDLIADVPDDDYVAPADRLVADERRLDVLRGFRCLSESCQQLLQLLATDPPLDYETIASMLGRPIGSIGPTRQRCLERLGGLLTTVDNDLTRRG